MNLGGVTDATSLLLEGLSTWPDRDVRLGEAAGADHEMLEGLGLGAGLGARLRVLCVRYDSAR